MADNIAMIPASGDAADQILELAFVWQWPIENGGNGSVVFARNIFGTGVTWSDSAR